MDQLPQCAQSLGGYADFASYLLLGMSTGYACLGDGEFPSVFNRKTLASNRTGSKAGVRSKGIFNRTVQSVDLFRNQDVTGRGNRRRGDARSICRAFVEKRHCFKTVSLIYARSAPRLLAEPLSRSDEYLLPVL